MITQDKQIISRLRKRISLLIILIFSLCYWIRINYYDLEWNSFEIDNLRQESIEKDEKITSLQKEIDSIKNNKQEVSTKKVKNIINTKKKEIQVKPDSVKTVENELLKPIETVVTTTDSTKN